MAKKQDEGVIVLSALEEDFLTLLMHGDRLYGLEILELLNEARQRQGMRKLGVGSLYPTLKRMEEAKLISGEWGEEVADSTRRRYYRITAEGEMSISRTKAYRNRLERWKDEQSIPEGQTTFGAF